MEKPCSVCTAVKKPDSGQGSFTAAVNKIQILVTAATHVRYPMKEFDTSDLFEKADSAVKCIRVAI